MRADPFIQLRLLDLQDLDSQLQRLAARRRSLPAAAVLAAADADIARLSSDLVGHETQAADHARAAGKIDNDIEQVRNRAARDQQRLDSGAVSAVKELENLQSEIASLGRRQAVLEDEELELLELREQSETAAAEVRAELEQVRARRSEAQAEFDRDLAAIDADAGRLSAQRAELAPQLPTDLVTLYERLRADRAGVGAAPLLRRRCEGCHLELAGNELTDVRAAAPDEVLRHEDCGRILVRTADSGL
jgi:predicted  nucleic acid-binding Zn-ribbon protein